MSYSFNNPCFNCEKKEQCTDREKVQEAVNKIHENCCDQGGHLGSGEILLMCTRCRATS